MDRQRSTVNASKAIDAAYEAYADAGIEPKDIQAAWCGTAFWATGMMLSVPLKLDYIPVTRVENVCGTGMEAVRAACYAVACRAYDLVLAVGIDKIKEMPESAAWPRAP